MVIVALSLSPLIRKNLFLNSLHTTTDSPQPPILIPKYPPPYKFFQNPPTNHLSLKHHHRFNNLKPVSRHGIVASNDDFTVAYLLSEAPFKFQFSYFETPKEKSIAIKEPVFLLELLSLPATSWYQYGEVVGDGEAVEAWMRIGRV
ncbi:CRS2-associated factor 2, chloroplastic-like [Arachis stenosperma]|uniref:CRS2-associated factor 2, chloroplastic-like n=1 Tax=Arachis stenosperma TaxID=217475 RepID=UPI0025ACFDA7|nr:CRS2-associated factor 2, chloroplastic-like [Arachis stenosperma]